MTATTGTQATAGVKATPGPPTQQGRQKQQQELTTNVEHWQQAG